MIEILFTCFWPGCKRKETQRFEDGMTPENVQPRRLHRLPDGVIYCLYHMRLNVKWVEKVAAKAAGR